MEKDFDGSEKEHSADTKRQKLSHSFAIEDERLASELEKSSAADDEKTGRDNDSPPPKGLLPR